MKSGQLFMAATQHLTPVVVFIKNLLKVDPSRATKPQYIKKQNYRLKNLIYYFLPSIREKVSCHNQSILDNYFLFQNFFSGHEIHAIDACGEAFNLDHQENTCVIHEGEGSLHDCTIEFFSPEGKKQICISQETLKLSCNSEVKYVRDHVFGIFDEEV